MSSCDCRGRFANGKEMARRRSVSREPQAMLACESLIQRRAASRDIDAVIHKTHRHKQRAASLLACESLIQSKRADELISASLSFYVFADLPDTKIKPVQFLLFFMHLVQNP